MRKKGFTLIEILIVVAILAILTLAVILSLSAQRRSAEDAKMKAYLDRLRIAFEDYYNDHNCYPPAAWFTTATSCGSNLLAPYLQTIQCDPHTGLPYKVTVDQTGCKWFIFTGTLGTAEPQPGCTTGNNCPTTNTYLVGSGNVSLTNPPSPSPSPTPTPTATPTPTPPPVMQYYCQNIGFCTSFDSTVWNCIPSYSDNKCSNSNNCSTTGSCFHR